MADHFADRLLAAIERKRSPVCVGLDPVVDRLPDELRRAAPLAGIETFCREVLQVVAPSVAAVKIQSAYFELHGAGGVDLYFRLVREARELGLIVIGDVKRGDIGSTAEAYAAGHLAGEDAPDAVTVNGYFGSDGVQPFVDAACANGRGVFILVRTSNPSAAALQDVTDTSGKKLFEHVADMVAALGADVTVGQRGYSCVGAVVGATWPDEARALRKIMDRQIFLVPGYGAQGATAADCAASFSSEGAGAIVNASRSVIYAFRDQRYADRPWRDAVGEAAREFAADLAAAVGL
ncbi:hypothetical protein LCGC14_0269150 [marine sediment metagenome]|uniref:Orotidine 5'-phosphate decarboxylase n=1 Tax=marine sediment metagenome TaxID=412755 RepID=A0A0F9WK46_9ZZZZ|nr:orotidine-5'-phosphate decarboxylase [Phycisphaerae bacterium]HDZ44230.1 orotidine-5'-phosphate decarboxylase [Phycisphaerae bacterium]